MLGLVLAFHMVSDVGWSGEPALTYVAGVAKLSGVGTQVVLERTRLGESLSTLGAFKRSVSRMHSGVDVQPGRGSEALSTDRTGVPLLAGVHDAPVTVQVPQPRELRTAFGTPVGPVSGVPAHVVLERAQTGEPLLTDVAPEPGLHVVGQPVHVQAAVVAEALVTDRAGERSLVGVVAHVCFEAARTLDLLPTDDANIGRPTRTVLVAVSPRRSAVRNTPSTNVAGRFLTGVSVPGGLLAGMSFPVGTAGSRQIGEMLPDVVPQLLWVGERAGAHVAYVQSLAAFPRRSLAWEHFTMRGGLNHRFVTAVASCKHSSSQSINQSINQSECFKVVQVTRIFVRMA